MSATKSSDPERRRLRAGLLFEQGRSQAEVARHLGVSRTTASRWAKLWDREGLAGLAEVRRAGREPRLSEHQLEEIDRSLLRGPMAHGYQSDLWTLPRISELIRQRTGVRYHPGHVWRLLRKLGWVRRSPAPSPDRTGESAVGRWVKMNRHGETSDVIRIGSAGGNDA